MNVFELVATLTMDSSQFEAELRKNRSTAENFGTNASTAFGIVNKAVTGLGETITKGSVTAIKSAMDFESAFTGVTKTVNFEGTQEEADAFFSSLRDGILELSYRLPTTASDIAAVTEAAGQLGIQNEYLLDFTETMIGLGSATNVSAEDAAIALARLAAVTGMSQDNFDELGSVITELGNTMATDEASIIHYAQQIGAVGHNFIPSLFLADVDKKIAFNSLAKFLASPSSTVSCSIKSDLFPAIAKIIFSGEDSFIWLDQ